MRNFFMALPESLEEAAIIDGASPLQVVLRNILTAGMIKDTEMIPIDQLPPAQSLKTAMIVVTVTPSCASTPSSNATSSRAS